MAGFGDELLIWRGPSGITDQSSYGHNGTYNGGMGTVSDTGSGGTVAFLLDGIDDFISIANPVVSAYYPTTIALWIKIPVVAVTNAVVTIGRSSGASHYLQMRYGSGSVNAAAAAGGTGAAAGKSGVGADSWYLVTALFLSAGSRSASVNAVYGATNTTSRSPTLLDELLVGWGRAGITTYFDGRIDDVRVFNRELTSGELADWLAAGRGYDVDWSSQQQRRTAQASIRSTF